MAEELGKGDIDKDQEIILEVLMVWLQEGGKVEERGVD